MTVPDLPTRAAAPPLLPVELVLENESGELYWITECQTPLLRWRRRVLHQASRQLGDTLNSVLADSPSRALVVDNTQVPPDDWEATVDGQRYLCVPEMVPPGLVRHFIVAERVPFVPKYQPRIRAQLARWQPGATFIESTSVAYAMATAKRLQASGSRSLFVSLASKGYAEPLFASYSAAAYWVKPLHCVVAVSSGSSDVEALDDAIVRISSALRRRAASRLILDMRNVSELSGAFAVRMAGPVSEQLFASGLVRTFVSVRDGPLQLPGVLGDPLDLIRQHGSIAQRVPCLEDAFLWMSLLSGAPADWLENLPRRPALFPARD